MNITANEFQNKMGQYLEMALMEPVVVEKKVIPSRT
jgi:hypothetical protein